VTPHTSQEPNPYDAILLVSFGGPEGPDDVLPFMENVTRGRGIPRERLIEVSAHYDLFGGVSPINAQNRALLEALEPELRSHGIDVPIYWGNRNWHPMLGGTLERMRADGITRALAFVTSAYSSASGCRQYREDIAKACDSIGVGAPVVDKVRVFYNHPGFIEPMVDAAVSAVESLRTELGSADGIRLACTAHSIPMSMADTSDYVQQLSETTRLVCEAVNQRLGLSLPSALVYQSRSGAPGQPWLEPDICDHLSAEQADGATGVVMIPVGFISDHMEVVYDLDTQAREHAASIGLPIRRAATVGTDPRFVSMIRELIQERFEVAAGHDPIRRALGIYGPNHDVCPVDCCPMPTRPVAPATRP
jgi:protoporphyrin/coproporphyrin ferrochelatase